MAVISFFFILCRDETGHGSVHRGSTNQCPGPQQHRLPAASSIQPPELGPISRTPGEYCHAYFHVYEMKGFVRRSALTTRILL